MVYHKAHRLVRQFTLKKERNQIILIKNKRWFVNQAGHENGTVQLPL